MDSTAALPCSLMHTLFLHLDVINVMVKAEHNSWLNCKAKTKCLNTGVILCILVLGRKFFQYCENDLVNTLAIKRPTRSASRLGSLVKHLNSSQPYSKLYYVIFTDGEFLCTGKNVIRNTSFFPGHIFLIEQLPNRQGFLIFQSYINEYDPTDTKGCRFFGHADMLKVFDVFHALFSGAQPRWTAKLRKNFYFFTGVETTSNWLSCQHVTQLDFRFSRVSRTQVYTNLTHTITNWIGLADSKPVWNCDNTTTMSSSQVRTALTSLLNDVQAHRRDRKTNKPTQS